MCHNNVTIVSQMCHNNVTIVSPGSKGRQRCCHPSACALISDLPAAHVATAVNMHKKMVWILSNNNTSFPHSMQTSAKHHIYVTFQHTHHHHRPNALDGVNTPHDAAAGPSPGLCNSSHHQLTLLAARSAPLLPLTAYPHALMHHLLTTCCCRALPDVPSIGRLAWYQPYKPRSRCTTSSGANLLSLSSL
jgi:hypothetical protein